VVKRQSLPPVIESKVSISLILKSSNFNIINDLNINSSLKGGRVFPIIKSAVYYNNVNVKHIVRDKLHLIMTGVVYMIICCVVNSD
jgi:hypothetical protein